MKKTSVTCAVCVLHGTDSHNIFSAGSSLLLLLRVCGLVCVMFAKGGLFNDLKTLQQLETFLKQMLSKFKLPSYPKGERTYCTSTQAVPVNLWITISDGLLSFQSLAVLIHTAYAWYKVQLWCLVHAVTLQGINISLSQFSHCRKYRQILEPSKKPLAFLQLQVWNNFLFSNTLRNKPDTHTQDVTFHISVRLGNSIWKEGAVFNYGFFALRLTRKYCPVLTKTILLRI